MDFAQALLQAQQKQAIKRAQYLANPAELDPDGQLPLDHPSLAGSNPVIDALISQVNMDEQMRARNAAQAQAQIGGFSPLDLAPEFLQEGPGTADFLQYLASLNGALVPAQAQAQPQPQAQPQDVAQAIAAPAQATAAPVQQPMSNQTDFAALLAGQIPALSPAPSIGDILNEANGTEQPATQSGQEMAGTRPASVESSLSALLNDPSMARMLVGMGASLTQGNSFATALQQGLATKDAFNSAVSETAYTAKKREADLTKTSAEVVKMIAEAGQSKDLGEKNRADARKATVEAGMASYNAETDRIKAQASQLSASAAIKQADLEVQSAVRKLEGTDPVSDQEHGKLFADVLAATNDNVILAQDLKAKGLSPEEYATLVLNRSYKADSNRRYIPLPESQAQNLRAERDRIEALPDTPENKALAESFENKILKDYQYIYGAAALRQALQGN